MLRRFLRILWTARRSNQSIFREINLEYLLEGLMLKLKLQCFGHLMRTDDSLEKSLILGKIEGRRRRGHQRGEMIGLHHQCNGHRLGLTSRNGKGQRGMACCSPWGCKGLDMPGWLNNNNSNILLVTYLKCKFSSVQSLSCVWLFVTSWTAARQVSLSITSFWSLPKLMSIESVMPSNHLILCHPLLLLPLIFPSIRVFSNESALCIRWPKDWEFQLQYQSFQWIYRTDFL